MPQHVAALIPFVFPLLWLAITGLLAVKSGWTELARAFPSPQRVDGKRFPFASGAMGSDGQPVSYGGCLFVTVGDAGIRMSVLLPFRLLSPPLFIPWREVAVVEVKRTRFFTAATIRLHGRDKIIRFRGDIGRRVLDTWARVGSASD